MEDLEIESYEDYLPLDVTEMLDNFEEVEDDEESDFQDDEYESFDDWDDE